MHTISKKIFSNLLVISLLAPLLPVPVLKAEAESVNSNAILESFFESMEMSAPLEDKIGNGSILRIKTNVESEENTEEQNQDNLLGIGTPISLSAEEYAKIKNLVTPIREFYYGSYWLELTDEDIQKIPVGVQYEVEEDAFVIKRGGYRFDPLLEQPDIPVELQAVEEGENEKGLYLIQFYAPAKNEWITSILDMEIKWFGSSSIGYGALVWATPNQLQAAQEQFDFIRAVVPFHGKFKIAPTLADKIGQTVDVDVWYYYDGTNYETTTNRLVELGGVSKDLQPHAPVAKGRSSMRFGFELGVTTLYELARMPQVMSLSWGAPIAPTDEVSALILFTGKVPATPNNNYYSQWQTASGVTGDGVIVAIQDDGIKHDHLDLQSMVDELYIDGYGDHGSHVAGIAVGTGNSGKTDNQGFLYGLGVAPGASYIDIDSDTLNGLGWPHKDRIEFSYQHGARIMNNSWRTNDPPNSGYTDMAKLYDTRVRDSNENPNDGLQSYTMVFAAGNEGPNANTISDPAEAKNIISVGNSVNARQRSGNYGFPSGTDENSIFDVEVGFRSSRGPCRDGRICPTLVAPGGYIASAKGSAGPCSSIPVAGSSLHSICFGTSMAAPQVTGAIALLHDWWNNFGTSSEWGTLPSPALAKAILVNNTIDMGAADIPNNNEGWGRLSLNGIMDGPRNYLYFNETTDRILIPDDTNTSKKENEWTYSVRPEDADKPLKISLVWTDPPSDKEPTETALMNNLDLSVQRQSDIGTNNKYLGNNFAYGWTKKEATGSADVLNNVENVYIQNPENDTYTVTVTSPKDGLIADGIPSNSIPIDQDFALAISNAALITAPYAGSPVIAGEFNAPGTITITTEWILPNLAKENFGVLIGGKNAIVTNTAADESNRKYTLTVQPPTQPATGFYDLEVNVKPTTENIWKTERRGTEASAVQYTDTGVTSDVILSPSRGYPTYAGSPSNPQTVKIRTQKVLGDDVTSQDLFASIKVGGKNANIVYGQVESDSYLFVIQPPQQTSEGFYDLTIQFADDELGNPRIYTTSSALEYLTPKTFPDVKADDWAKKYINFVSRNEVVKGFENGNFGPGNDITRAEALKMAVVAFTGYVLSPEEEDADCTQDPIPDVPKTEWYCHYVERALASGYIPNENFRPTAKATRLDVTKFISNMKGISCNSGSCSMKGSPYPLATSRKSFSDIQTSNPAYSDTYWMLNTKMARNGQGMDSGARIIRGYPDGEFKSGQNVSRAEVSKIIANTLVHFQYRNDPNVGYQPFAVEGISLQDAESESFIGKLPEQVYITPNTAPAVMHLNGNDAQTISKDTPLSFDTTAGNFSATDSDGDVLTYFWNATGGSFTTTDEVNFHEVTWQPPAVTEETVFEINVTRGDGRGLIGEGRFEITVMPDGAPTPTPTPTITPLVPTIHSKTSGGNWNSAATWVEDRVPTADDVVEINGTVTVNVDATVVGLKVNLGGTLWNRYGYNTSLTVTGSVENAGDIRNDAAGVLSLNVSGNITNTKLWRNHQTTLTGTNMRHIETTTPITGTVIFGDSFELLSSPQFNGSTKFNGKTITLASDKSITVRSSTTFPLTLVGGGKLVFDGTSQNISGTITAAEIVFGGSGSKTIYNDVTLNGNLEVINGITVWNRYGYNTSLTVTGSVENAGDIRNDAAGVLSLNVSGNITNTKLWRNHQTTLSGTGQKQLSSGANAIGSSIVLGDNFEVIGNPVFSGSVNLNGKTLTINTPHSASFGGMTETGVITGTGTVASTGNTTATIMGNIPLFEIDGTSQNISGTITAAEIVFGGSGSKTIYNDVTLNGNLEVINGITVWNRYGYNTSLTVTGSVENAGDIRNDAAGVLSLNVSGNITNTKLWRNHQTTLTGTNMRHIETTTPITGTVIFGDSFELLSSPQFNGSTKFNGKTITLASDKSITVRSSTTFPLTLVGGGKLVFDGTSQNISGTITAAEIVFGGSGSKTIYNDVTLNGNLEVINGITVWNRYGYNTSLTVTGSVENAGDIRNDAAGVLSLNVSGNITNTKLWRNHRTSLIWTPIPGATAHEIRLREGVTGDSNTIALGNAAAYNITNLLSDNLWVWQSRQQVSGAWSDWSDAHFITTDSAYTPPTVTEFSDVIVGDWAYPFVMHAAERDIVSGFDDATFRPGESATKAEVLKMAYRSSGRTTPPDCEPGDAQSFPDVALDAWYCGLVKDGKQKGFVTGTVEGFFEPNKVVSRAEAAVLLSRLFEVEEGDLECLLNSKIEKRRYSDVSPENITGHGWFYHSVIWMSNARVKAIDGDGRLAYARDKTIVKGYAGDLFRPFGNVLRSEASKMAVNTKNFFRDPAVQARGCTPVLQAFTLQDAEIVPEIASIGNLYEQEIINAATNTAPDALHLTGTDERTIFANEPIHFQFTDGVTGDGKTDADGDVLFYSWNAIGGGSFSADEPDFSKVTWTPPPVQTETVFVINVVRGDGRGKVGEGQFTITVLPVESVTSIPAGGDWSNSATWDSAAVPGSEDHVVIDSVVYVDTDITVASLQITANGRLLEAPGGPYSLTILGLLYNDGELGDSDPQTESFAITVTGDAVNNGALYTSKNTVGGTLQNNGSWGGGLSTSTLPDVADIPGDAPFTGTLVVTDDLTVTKTTEVPGTLDPNGKTITVPDDTTLVVDNLTGTGTINGNGILVIRGDILVSGVTLNTGTLLFDDAEQQIAGNLTAPNMIFENGVKSFGNTTLNGNVYIKGLVTFQNIPGQRALLHINGTLNNEGTIRNAPGDFAAQSAPALLAMNALSDSGNLLFADAETAGFDVRITGRVTSSGQVKNSRVLVIGDLVTTGDWQDTETVLSWDAVADATHYELQTGAPRATWNPAALVAATNFVVPDPDFVQGFFWRIRPVFDSGVGEWQPAHAVNADPADVPRDDAAPPLGTLFCPELSQAVTYLPVTPQASDCSNAAIEANKLQLLDSSCAPIVGARVNLRRSNNSYLTNILTDENGIADFATADLATDPDHFEVDYHGSTFSTEAATFTTGATVQTQPFALTLTASDCSGIAGARVNLRRANNSYVTMTATDTFGKASFEVLPASTMRLEADYNGSTWQSEAITPTTEVLLGTERFALILSTSSDEKIPNVRVNLRRENGSYVKNTTTDDGGTAAFEVLPSAAHILGVDYSGATLRTPVSTAHAAISVATVPYSLALTDSEDSAIAGARVNLRRENNSYITKTETDQSGIATFEVLPGAELRLEADYQGGTLQTAAQAVDTALEVPVKTLSFGAILTSTGGTAIPNARINLRRANSSYVTNTTTNAQGIGVFEVLPGTQNILEVDYNGAKYQTAIITVGENTLQEITLATDLDVGVGITTGNFGVAFTDSLGSPLAGVRVNLRRENNSYVTKADTDENGIAAFDVVPGAVMRLEVDYNGATYSTQPIIVDGQVIVPISTNPFALKLTDSAGEVISNVRINLRRENGSYVTKANTDETGTAAFEVVPGARMKLEVDYNGATHQTEVFAIEAPAEVEVATLPFALILTNSENDPLIGVRINLRRENGSYVTKTNTDEGGIASFEVVPSARMKLEADFNGGVYQTSAAQIDDATEIEVSTLPLAVALTSGESPLPNQRVDLLRENASYITNTSTDVNGNAAFEVLPGVLHKLRATRNGVTWVSDAVSGGGEIVSKSF